MPSPGPETRDTIVGPATPLAAGPVAIVRLSGAEARPIGEALSGRSLVPSRFTFAAFARGGVAIDQGYAVYLPGPRTYTGEDVCELQCHGNPGVVRDLVEACLALGARAAERGEFTLRAFLNGRLDLAQAEAVQDLVAARTAGQRRSALAGLAGRRSVPLKQLRESLLGTLAYLSARADFPDEDVPPRDLGPEVGQALAAARALLSTADAGVRLREGVRTAIIGAPNTGKSSLLNRLLAQDRAIVTDVPGTTRDTLEETLDVRGVPFVLVDTAGLRRGAGRVEAIGIERTLAEVEGADLLLCLFDASRELLTEERDLIARTEGRNRLLLFNKVDLLGAEERARIPAGGLAVSALTGEGVEELEAAMLRAADLEAEAEASVTTARQKAALTAAVTALERTAEGLAERVPEDLLTAEVREAVYQLGLITGESVTEDLLDTIFSRFCIGK